MNMAENDDFDLDDGSDGSEERQAPSLDERFDKLESRLEGRLSQITTALEQRDRAQETRDIRSRIATRSAQVENTLKASERAVDAAEQTLADAYDGGEAAVIARAQRDLSEKIAAREHARVDKRNHEAAVRQMERRAQEAAAGGGRTASEGAKDTKNLDKWKEKHSSWYGVNAEMTKAAHAIDEEIREAGVIPVGSQQYFEAIDRKMARQFPEHLRSTPDNSSGGPGGGRATGGGGGGGGRIPADVLDGWSRMGIDVSDPKTLERMVANRAALADKGILPDRPAYGIVRPR